MKIKKKILSNFPLNKKLVNIIWRITYSGVWFREINQRFRDTSEMLFNTLGLHGCSSRHPVPDGGLHSHLSENKRSWVKDKPKNYCLHRGYSVGSSRDTKLEGVPVACQFPLLLSVRLWEISSLLLNPINRQFLLSKVGSSQQELYKCPYLNKE